MSTLSPSSTQAKKMVLASMFVMALVTVYRDRKSSSPQGTYRTLWAVAVVGFFLSLLADFLPQVAGPFAGLVALGSFTHGGDQVLQKVLGTITPQPGSGSSSPPGPSSSRTQTGPNTTRIVTTGPTGTTITNQTGP